MFYWDGSRGRYRPGDKCPGRLPQGHQGRRQAAALGGSLHASCERPRIRKLLWLTEADRRIPLAATVEGALRLLAALACPDNPGLRPSTDH